MPTAERPTGSNLGSVDEPTKGLKFDNHAVAYDRQRLEHDSPNRRDATKLEEELLQTRDELIAAEARLGESLGRIRVLETELGRYQAAGGQFDRLARSPLWRLQGLYERLRGMAGRLRARAAGKHR